MSIDLTEAKENFYTHVSNLQDAITQALKAIDPEIKLIEDIWERKDFLGLPGGGGRTRAFTGNIIENAGVNISRVFGAVDPQFSEKMDEGSGQSMFACGISLIIHPRNPKVPTVHANFRMIERGNKFWFGGGADLTPFFPFEDDFTYFHTTWKKACSPYNCYEAMKKTCDEYFVNYHRNNEMRGIGGIFFDYLNSSDLNHDLHMVKDLSSHFIQSYFPIVEKRKNETFNAADVDFQLHRRGRYVEFNLLHDRGTSFGLKTNGRVDSILISLPARAHFTYKYAPLPSSPHAKMLTYYYPKDWINYA